MIHPNIIISDNIKELEEKLQLYLHMATKFIYKNKNLSFRYQVFSLNDNWYSLVIFYIKNNEPSPSEIEMFNISMEMYNSNQLNQLIPKW